MPVPPTAAPAVAFSVLAASAPLPALDPARVVAIATLLPDAPAASGRPIADRAFWDKVAADPRYAGIIPNAEKLLNAPLPPWPADSFLDYSRDGNRTRYQNAENARRSRLTVLALAECLENKGRFITPLAALVDSLCEEKTWVLPAHDARLENYNGKTIDIDLVSSALAVQFGTTDYLLGDKLPPATRQRLRENVTRRVLDPFRDMINGKREPNWWLTTENNWNAVCLNGVVGASLALEPSRQERARFVAAAERYSQSFLSGFTADGYCGEGLGYWNYGFGNYDVLCEGVRQATGGKLDLLARPAARMPALFAARIQIMNDISPAFADCPVLAKPSAPLMVSLNRRFALGLPQYARLSTALTGSIYETMVYLMAETAPPLPSAGKGSSASGLPLRDFFDAAGILIARPGANGTAKLGAALKGGSNAESHNHNDVGSYVVVVGDRPVLLDPGAETYTARTFSARRYDSKLLNSFGHPVPKFGDILQRTGAQARGKVVKTVFTPDADTFTLDIASAYALPDLKSLTRTWVYSRKGDGALTVTDNVSLSRPTPFGTALLTLGGWQKNPDGTLFVYDGENAVMVKIDTGGKPYTVTETIIHEDAPVTPTRIGIDLTDPVTNAAVTLTITPAGTSGGLSADGDLLRNGGFERGGFGWSLSSMGSVSTDPATSATGTGALRVRDDAANGGSDIASVRTAVPAGTARLSLKGKVRFVSGDGIGLYVRFFDRNNKSLTVQDANGNEAAAGALTGAAYTGNQWKPFAFSAAVPSGAVTAQVWIHSFNAARCDAYLDDLSLTPEK